MADEFGARRSYLEDFLRQVGLTPAASAVNRLDFMNADYTVKINVRYFDLGSGDATPKSSRESVSMLRTRFAPFNIVSRREEHGEWNLYFIPPRPVLMALSGEDVAFLPIVALIPRDQVRVKEKRVVLEPVLVGYYDGYGRFKALASLQSHPIVDVVSDMLKNTGYSIKGRGILESVNLYNVKLRRGDYLLLYLYVDALIDHHRGVRDARLRALHGIRIGAYADASLVYGYSSSEYYLRMALLGFDLERLRQFLGLERLGFHSQEQLNARTLSRVAFDFTWALQQGCGGSQRRSRRRGSHVDDHDLLCDSLSVMNGSTLGELLDTYELILPGQRRIRVPRANRVSSVRHAFEKISIVVHLGLRPGRSGVERKRLVDGPISVDVVKGIVFDYVLEGYRIALGSNWAPYIPLARAKVRVREGVGLEFYVGGAEGGSDIIWSALRTAASIDPYFERRLALRLTILREYYGNKKYSVPCICSARGGPQGCNGFINLLDLGRELANAWCYYGASGGSRASRESGSIIETYQDYASRVDNILAGPEELRSNRGLRRILGCMAVWSFVYPFIKALSEVLGEEFLDSTAVECMGGEEGCRVAVYELGDYGVGFIEMLESSLKSNAADNLVKKALDLAFKTATLCGRLARARAGTQAALLEECITRVARDLEGAGLPPLYIDELRVVIAEIGRDIVNRGGCRRLAEGSPCRRLFADLADGEDVEARQALPGAYAAAAEVCWDGCPGCVHISMREWPWVLTDHEQRLFVSAALAQALLAQSRPANP